MLTRVYQASYWDSGIEVQRALSLSGFYNGAFDGIFGEKTAQAVRAFQTSNRLTSDGVIGANTWTALIKRDNQI